MLNNCRKLYIPHSGRRFYIDESGEVFTNDGLVLDVRIVDGRKVVRLDWIFGSMEYDVGMLVLLANGHFRDFQDHLLLKVESLYKDGDPRNTRLGNLVYRFKDGPLEVEGFPGYYYIPFFTRYAISVTGDMITAAYSSLNNRMGEVRKWSILPPNKEKGSPGGYRYLRAIADNGESKILFRHQALCWTFKQYGANVRSLVCNHLDGKPGSDDLDNLELTTYSANNAHAYRMGLKKSKGGIVVMNLKTSERRIVHSAKACQEIVGSLTVSTIMHRLHDPIAKMRVYSDYWVFRRENDSAPIPDFIAGVTEVVRATEDRAIAGMDIFSGDVFIGENCSQLGKGLRVSYLAIRNRLTNDDPRPFKGYCFKYLDDKRGWPQFSERQLEIHRKYRHKDRTPNGVIVVDSRTGEEHFFHSRFEAAVHFKLSPGTVYQLAKEEAIFAKRYRFTMFNIHEGVSWSP